MEMLQAHVIAAVSDYMHDNFDGFMAGLASPLRSHSAGSAHQTAIEIDFDELCMWRGAVMLW